MVTSQSGYLRTQGRWRMARGGKSFSCMFSRRARGSEVPFLNCFYSILATVFRPEIKTECSTLTKIHLIALLPHQYESSTY